MLKITRVYISPRKRRYAYVEFYFPEVEFQAFNAAEFDKALEEFSKRNRRFGGQ